jgi:hypothetical protein
MEQESDELDRFDRVFVITLICVQENDSIKERHRARSRLIPAYSPLSSQYYPNVSRRFTMQQASHYCKNSIWYKEMKSSFQSPGHPHDLNSSQVTLCCASRSSSVLIPELHASNSSISNCCDEENSPDTRNNSTDGENQDVNPGENEWSVGGNDECLDR